LKFLIFKQGVTHILSGTCCGSLKEDFAPGHLVILDSFIDRTTKRPQTFHDQGSNNQSSDFGTVCHIPMHPSFCPKTSSVIAQAGQDLGMTNLKSNGTVVTIEGRDGINQLIKKKQKISKHNFKFFLTVQKFKNNFNNSSINKQKKVSFWF
jgi:hypothetical protein